MRAKGFTRRRFLLASGLSLPLAALADCKWLEPTWVKIRHVALGSNRPTHRIVQFSDVHHKCDRPYFESVVRKINELSPDLVCFTGDLIEEGRHLPEALEVLSGIKSPMYGVPGNHDYWSKVPFAGIARCFAASGGAWLLDEAVETRDGKLAITGAAFLTFKSKPMRVVPGKRNILLMHYPAWIEKLGRFQFDLVLAGHSHGGQVRLPGYGPLIIPFAVDGYDLGLFRTPSGPLYVNPGIGWYPIPIRFNCRPEITVFEL
jgi:uncharacterized protein